MARKTRQIEVKMVSEYLLAHYPSFPTLQAVPLGKVDESLMAEQGYKRAIGLMRPYRPEVDAVVVLPRHLVLIEAKVFNVIDGLLKLPLYKSLVPFTPELQQYKPREVLMELVVGWVPDNLQIMAREANVRVVEFAPDWIKEVVEKQHYYWTREYRQERDRKLRMREFLGLE